MPSIDERLEKFIVERDAFKTAVHEAFVKADADNNGVLSPPEATAMTDAVFDHIERELKEYNLDFERPSEEVVRKLIEVADKDGNYVLNEDEFFEFYREVIRYCATVAKRGWTRFLPPMVIGAFISCFVKCSMTQKTPDSPMECIPALIVGSVLGLISIIATGDKRLQKKLFVKDKPPRATQ